MVLTGRAGAFQLDAASASPSCLGLKNSLGDVLVMGANTNQISCCLAITLLKCMQLTQPLLSKSVYLVSICQECLEDRMASYNKCHNSLKDAERVTLAVVVGRQC